MPKAHILETTTALATSTAGAFHYGFPRLRLRDPLCTVEREACKRLHIGARLGVMADNAGMWMVHCHILDHAEAGMMRMLMVQ